MSDGVYLMVVSPHPDDCEFGISGTVAKLAREGREIVYIIVTNGNKGTSDRKLTPAKLVKIREKEELAAARLLGVKETVFLGYPDQQLEDCNELRMDICRQIRRFKPDIVATNDPYRKYMSHRDHRICGMVTMDAVYPYARDFLAYPELMKEGLEPHKAREIWFWGTEDPNYKVNIGASLDLKLEALRCHKSQFDVTPEMQSRLIEFARQGAKGEKYPYAEVFHRVELRP